MSNLPGDNADKGEGLNRHRSGRKRNRKVKPFSERDGKKRSDEDVDAIGKTNSASGTRSRGHFGRNSNGSDAGFDGNSSPAGEPRQMETANFGKRDGRPGVKRNTRPNKATNNFGGVISGDGVRGGGRWNSGGDSVSVPREAPRKHVLLSEQSPGNMPNLPHQNRGSNATGEAAPTTRQKNKSRKRGGKGANRALNDEQRLARSLRQPLQPVPDVVYQPKAVRQVDKPQTVRNDHRGASARRSPAETGRNRIEPYAALDLGTNNCRLLVALPQERGRFRVIDGFSRIVRLGEGLGQSGKLSEGAMDRALEALKTCSEKLISHNIKRHRLIATEACRQAANGEHFLQRVHSETGMKLEIIDRETEAHLAAEGCGSLMDRKADAAVLFDIGGGSSELVLVNRRHRKMKISEQIVSWTSLPVGVVTLAERHGGKHVDHKIFANMIDEVKGHINAFEGRDELQRLWRSGRVHLLGTSGTVTTLAGIHLGLPRYERRLVDGVWLNSADIDQVVKDLLLMDYEQRAASPCIGRERADLVMAGCAILEAIRQTWPSEKLRVADRGLREGILTQMMERDAAWLPAKANRWRRNKSPNKRARANGQSGGQDKGRQER